MARQLDELYETDAAVEQLREVIEARPKPPFESLPTPSSSSAGARSTGSTRRALAAYRDGT
jgi:hypothetical protein